MFLFNDPQLQLDLHRQHVAEMIREADDDRRARAVTAGRHRRFGRFGRFGDSRERRAENRMTAAA
jgi:hypothetical protein